MIGVLANQADVPIVREFFELFKTPWEFYRDGRGYDLLLCCDDNSCEIPTAPLVIIYTQPECPSEDALSGGRNPAADGVRLLSYHGAPLPIYRGSVTFNDVVDSPLRDLESQQPALLETKRDGTRLIRIGYDLFAEVHYLLKSGQPVGHAAIPTLDLHVALLRDLIRSAGVPLVEIPPVPHGYGFLTCLTHDVDHPFVRHHKFDHTMFGFLYRALIGSTIDLVERRTSASNWFRNVFAALKLPFVYLGLAVDFWSTFDCYLEIEDGRPSTFFIIPFSKTQGCRPDGMAPKTRAAAYGASDLTDQVRRLSAAGCEVGLHGIDAWVDDAKGRNELNAIRSLTGADEIGVRMHWLYFNGQSPVVVENAGARYDSTVGYNETVGFRAGTSQVYKPLNATTLLELPLHIMDTALFYPTHLHLSPKDAEVRINHVIDAVVKHNGCLTVNWHDRSIAPERLWTDTYVNLVNELTDKGAWFATAGQAIAWFRMRRSVVFETDAHGTLRMTMPTRVESLPALTLRTWDSSGRAIDIDFSEVTEVSPMPELAPSEL
jgi:hypothetical protein